MVRHDSNKNQKSDKSVMKTKARADSQGARASERSTTSRNSRQQQPVYETRQNNYQSQTRTSHNQQNPPFQAGLPYIQGQTVYYPIARENPLNSQPGPTINFTQEGMNQPAKRTKRTYKKDVSTQSQPSLTYNIPNATYNQQLSEQMYYESLMNSQQEANINLPKYPHPRMNYPYIDKQHPEHIRAAQAAEQIKYQNQKYNNNVQQYNSNVQYNNVQQYNSNVQYNNDQQYNSNVQYNNDQQYSINQYNSAQQYYSNNQYNNAQQYNNDAQYYNNQYNINQYNNIQYSDAQFTNGNCYVDQTYSSQYTNQPYYSNQQYLNNQHIDYHCSNNDHFTDSRLQAAIEQHVNYKPTINQEIVNKQHAVSRRRDQYIANEKLAALTRQAKYLQKQTEQPEIKNIVSAVYNDINKTDTMQVGEKEEDMLDIEMKFFEYDTLTNDAMFGLVKLRETKRDPLSRRKTQAEALLLNHVYSVSKYPTTTHKVDMCLITGMGYRSVDLWFQNRRKNEIFKSKNPQMEEFSTQQYEKENKAAFNSNNILTRSKAANFASKRRMVAEDEEEEIVMTGKIHIHKVPGHQPNMFDEPDILSLNVPTGLDWSLILTGMKFYHRMGFDHFVQNFPLLDLRMAADIKHRISSESFDVNELSSFLINSGLCQVEDLMVFYTVKGTLLKSQSICTKGVSYNNSAHNNKLLTHDFMFCSMFEAWPRAQQLMYMRLRKNFEKYQSRIKWFGYNKSQFCDESSSE